MADSTYAQALAQVATVEQELVNIEQVCTYYITHSK